MRGQPGRVDALVIVSFDSAEACMRCLGDPQLLAKVTGRLGIFCFPFPLTSTKPAVACLARHLTTHPQYPSLAPAADARIVADRDGYYSIEFTNAGMSGVREITNEFSRHGEIVKVQQSGARNAVKRVTVSYAELEAALAAIAHYASSNDVRGIDFVPECVET